MKDRKQISIDFNEALRIANTMRDIAAQMNDESKKMATTNENVRMVWTGQCANEFVDKSLVMREKVVAASKKIKKAADKIEQIARITYNAEMAALNAIQTKSVSANK